MARTYALLCEGGQPRHARSARASALTIVAGAASGLNHAHERRAPDGTPLGIVHRDVSPSNLMIGYDGAVKLLDFGIAKATQRSDETQSGIIKGKFAYMAPEQCRGRDVDKRSDVFSLGIILYEITTQHRCFRADSDFDTMHRIVTGDVVRPTRLVQGYPQALEAIVMKALAIDASQRYQSATFLLEALESFAVASRMSLSTMALGRFMREMFGEIPEPWLVTGRMNAVMPPKKNTISSTDGRGSGAQRAMRGPLTEPPPITRAPRAKRTCSAQPTLLDLPRGLNDTDREDPNARRLECEVVSDDAACRALGFDSHNRRMYPPAGSAPDTIPTQIPAGTQPLSLPISGPQGAFAAAPSGSGAATSTQSTAMPAPRSPTRNRSSFPQDRLVRRRSGSVPTCRRCGRTSARCSSALGVMLWSALRRRVDRGQAHGRLCGTGHLPQTPHRSSAPDRTMRSAPTMPRHRPRSTRALTRVRRAARDLASIRRRRADRRKKVGVTPLDTKIKRGPTIKRRRARRWHRSPHQARWLRRRRVEDPI